VELHSLFGAYLEYAFKDGDNYNYREPKALSVPFEPEGKSPPHWRNYGEAKDT
jgi:hypothetical protein